MGGGYREELGETEGGYGGECGERRGGESRVERRGRRGREEERWEGRFEGEWEMNYHVDTTTAHMHAGSTSGVSTSVVCQALCEFQGCRKRNSANSSGYS